MHVIFMDLNPIHGQELNPDLSKSWLKIHMKTTEKYSVFKFKSNAFLKSELQISCLFYKSLCKHRGIRNKSKGV